MHRRHYSCKSFSGLSSCLTIIENIYNKEPLMNIPDEKSKNNFLKTKIIPIFNFLNKLLMIGVLSIIFLSIFQSVFHVYGQYLPTAELKQDLIKLIPISIINCLLIYLLFHFNKKFKNASHHKTISKFVEWISGPVCSSLLIVFLFLSIELFARHYVGSNEFGFNNRYMRQIDFSFLRGETYNNDVFISEQNATDHYFNEQLQMINPVDQSGLYINIFNGKRVTSNQPSVAKNTIYIFGGSTIQAMEVPDEMTIPSYLQRLLNSSNLNYRVENMGVTAIKTSEQLTLLKNAPIKTGDIVIFYDGINDATELFWRYFHIIPSATRFDRAIKYFLLWFSPQSVFYEFFLAPYNYLPSIVRDEALQQNTHLASMETYINNIHESHLYSQSMQAHFIHFIQPNLFSLPEYSSHENKIVQSYQILGNGKEKILKGGFQAILSTNQTLTDLGIYSYDISETLDPQYRQPGQEFYYDFCHVNHEGNEIIANRIFEIILPHLLQWQAE